MVTIALTFTAGRYSATRWGHHVNEGAIEWPPSPWRLLRALVAVWKNTLPELSDDVVGGVITKLAGPPQFVLPRVATAHTRHYMPMARSERSMIFDTSIVIDRHTPVLVQWPEVALTADEHALLDLMLHRLPYLGRAESWCAAELHDGRDNTARANAYPVADEYDVGRDNDIVNILTAECPLQLPDLMVTTADLRRLGHDPHTPPGARWQQYARSRDCFSAEATCRPRITSDRITMARYRLVGPVLPTIFRTVDIAEASRRALLGIYGRRNGDDTSRALSGKAADGTPLMGQQHASYFPVDEDADGRLDHLFVWAPGGLNQREQDALGVLETLRVGRELELKLALTYLGGEQEEQQSRILGRSRTWVSLTPYMLSRHPKTRKNGTPRLGPDGMQIDGPEDQIRRELRLRGLPAPRSITRKSQGMVRGRLLSWQDFHRWRTRGGPPAETTGFGYIVTFEDEVSGPMSLGYGSHFGLGLFGRQLEETLNA